MSLINCINRAAKNINDVDKQRLIDYRQRHLDSGLSEQEADQAALDQFQQEFTQETEEIAARIESAGGTVARDTSMKLIHTSPTAITEINSFGRFGEFLFFAADEYVMTAGDHVTYSIELEASEIIEAGQIFYHEDAEKLASLVEQVMEMVGVDEDTAEELIAQREDVYSIDTDIEPEDLGDIAWDIQRITGEAALILGFRGVEMQDEQGTAYLIHMKGHEADLEAAGEEITLSQAQDRGYGGDNPADAQEWVSGVSRGTDMSEQARFERARDMGFDIMNRVYHGTNASFPAFEVGRTGERFLNAERTEVESQGVFFSDSPEDAAQYGENVDAFFIRREKTLGDGAGTVDDLRYILEPITQTIQLENGTQDTFVEVNGGLSRLAINDDTLAQILDEGMDWHFLDNPEVVARLKELGYDSAVVHEPGDASGYSLFVTDPANIRSVDAAFDPGQSGSAQVLAQPNRAEIQFFDDDTAIINLGKTADKSSFLHETGHLFLEMERRLAAKYGLSNNQTALLNWLGIESFDALDTTTPEGVELHEKFARGFEQYLREGRAPSRGLREAFHNFKIWLKQIYKRAIELDVELDDSIREVFDRLLASEAEIEIAKDNEAYADIFQDIADSAMTDAEWSAYVKQKKRRDVSAQDALDKKVIDQYMRAAEKKWVEERDEIAEQEKAALEKTPTFAAVEHAKNEPMDYDEVMRIHGSIPGKLVGKAKKDGQDPAMVAEQYGMTAEQLLNQIAESGNINDEAKANADAIMLEQYGDILNDGTIEREAQEAIHSEEQAKLLLMEMKALNRSQKQTDNSIVRADLKNAAREIIGALRPSQIRPDKYHRAEIKAAVAAKEAAMNGDTAEAARQKQIQLGNFYLFKEALSAQEQVEKIGNYIRGVRTRKYNASQVDQEYFQNMQLLVNMYDTRKTADRTKMLSQIIPWFAGQVQSKENFFQFAVIDPWLMKAIVEYETTGKIDPDFPIPTLEDLTVDGLKGLQGQLKSMRFVGGKIAEGESAEFKGRMSDIAESIRENYKGKQGERVEGPTAGQRFTDALVEFVGGIASLGNILRTIDGFQDNGPMMREIWQKVNDATGKRRKMQQDMVATMKRELGGTMNIGVGKNEYRTFTRENGTQFDLSTEGRFMVAVYWGTQSSREAIMEGHGITEQTAMEIIASLTEDQLNAVNAVWKVNEQNANEFFRVSAEMLSAAPDKLPPSPFEVNGVKMTGGHMRLFYDDAVTQMKEKGENMANVNKIMPNRNGSTYNRTGSGGKKVSLDKNNIFRSLDEAINYMAYAETGRELNRMLKNRDIVAAIEGTYGRTMYKNLVGNLEGILGNREVRENARPLAAASRMVRGAMTAKYLMYSLRNTVQQFSALPIAINEVGAQAFLDGMARYSAGEAAMMKEKSSFMRDRTTLVNREAAEFMAQHLTDSTFKQAFQVMRRAGFTPQTIIDTIIATPTWLGKYHNSLDLHGDEARAIREADLAVSESVGSGADEHLGAWFQSNQSEFVKTMTIFGSWFNAYMQRVYRDSEGFTTFNLRTANSAILMPAIAAVIAEVLISHGPDDDEEWYEYAGESWFYFMTGTAPVLREFGTAARGYGGASPIAEAAGGAWQAIEGAMDLLDGEGEQGLLRISKGITNFVPAPGSGQLIRAYEGFSDPNQDPYGAIVEGKIRN